MSDTELKPCPCCGGKATFDYQDTSVFCVKCGIQTACHSTEKTAVSRWNTRTPEHVANSPVVSREAIRQVISDDWIYGGLVDKLYALQLSAPTLPSVMVEEIIVALSPVQTIICPEPASGSVADSFAKGCPLTPKQIRAMQDILSHLVSRGIGRSE